MNTQIETVSREKEMWREKMWSMVPEIWLEENPKEMVIEFLANSAEPFCYLLYFGKNGAVNLATDYGEKGEKYLSFFGDRQEQIDGVVRELVRREWNYPDAMDEIETLTIFLQEEIQENLWEMEFGG